MSSLPVTELTDEQRKLAATVVPVIEQLAKRHKRKYPRADLDELMGAGNDAVVKAAMRYVAEAGSFEKFAFKWIEGAMLKLVSKESAHAAKHVWLDALPFFGPDPVDEDGGGIDAIASRTHADHHRELLDDLRGQAGDMAVAFAGSAAKEALKARALFEERVDRLDSIVETLPERSRLVFVRSYREGKTDGEIARELDVVERTVRRIRVEMREHILEALLATERPDPR